METSAQEAMAGQTGREQIIADNALAYAALLREHIAKEDEILYPLAERVIPDTMRDDIIAGYAAAEARTAADFSDRYEAAVVGYELE
jgi:hemerythrin-like domain-containing protein